MVIFHYVMKITFICGGLEPGCDGVGDYTRRLAGELIRQGGECNILALNDRQITGQAALGQEQNYAGQPIICHRFSHLEGWHHRIREAKAVIDDFAPQWLSVQYVPYAFQDRGLHFGLTGRLMHLAGKTKIHIMFHELWIGMEAGASLKQVIVGSAQKWLIQGLLSRLEPQAVSTHSSLYIEQLSRIGRQADQLPLFGNIPATDAGPAQRLENCSPVEFVLFGSIHSGAPVDDFAADCARYSEITGRQVRLTVLGRCGPQQDVWRRSWECRNLTVQVLGERTEMEVSRILHSATCGLATTPLALIEKSSAAASMLEHSLPVISVGPVWNPRGVSVGKPPYGIFPYNGSNFAQIMTRIQEVEIKGKVASDVSGQFADTLARK